MNDQHYWLSRAVAHVQDAIWEIQHVRPSVQRDGYIAELTDLRRALWCRAAAEGAS